MNDRRSKHARSNCFLSIHSFLVEFQTNAWYIHATHVWKLGLQFPLVACNRPCTWNSVTPGNIHTHPTESHWTFLRGRGLGNWQTQMEFPGGVGGRSKVQTNNPLGMWMLWYKTVNLLSNEIKSWVSKEFCVILIQKLKPVVTTIQYFNGDNVNCDKINFR